MLTNDLTPVSVAPLPAPSRGGFVEDVSFGGTRIYRVTDAAADGVPGAGIVPMYTNTQAWNADESMMILYAPKSGWRLYQGQPPFSFIGPLSLPDPPNSPEMVHWSVTNPLVFRYLGSSGAVYEVNLISGVSTLFQVPKAPNQNVLMETHTRPSWDDKIWGFGTWTDDSRTNKRLIVADISTGEELMNIGYQDLGGDPVNDKGTLGVPMISPDGERCIVFVGGTLGRFYVLGLRPLRFLRVVPADWTFEHQALGKLSVPELSWETDVYYSKTQGKNILSTQIAYMMTCALELGTVHPTLGYEVCNHRIDLPYVKGPDGTFPYASPAGVHISAVAYQNPNWVWYSMMPPAQAGYSYPGGTLETFQQEIWRVNLITNTVERLAHHRSAARAMNNIHEYWQEPHPCVSPSGRFCVFGSDWSFDLPEGQRATKADSWVVDLQPT